MDAYASLRIPLNQRSLIHVIPNIDHCGYRYVTFRQFSNKNTHVINHQSMINELL